MSEIKGIDTTKILTDFKLIKGIVDDSQDDVIKIFIEFAVDKLLFQRYPYDRSKTSDDLIGYDTWVLRAVRSIYDTQGQYNITQFAQNGVQITYSSLEDGISSSMLNEIVPEAKAVE